MIFVSLSDKKFTMELLLTAFVFSEKLLNSSKLWPSLMQSHSHKDPKRQVSWHRTTVNTTQAKQHQQHRNIKLKLIFLFCTQPAEYGGSNSTLTQVNLFYYLLFGHHNSYLFIQYINTTLHLQIPVFFMHKCMRAVCTSNIWCKGLSTRSYIATYPQVVEQAYYQI